MGAERPALPLRGLSGVERKLGKISVLAEAKAGKQFDAPVRERRSGYRRESGEQWGREVRPELA